MHIPYLPSSFMVCVNPLRDDDFKYLYKHGIVAIISFINDFIICSSAHELKSSLLAYVLEHGNVNLYGF